MDDWGNHIEIANKSVVDGAIRKIGYQEISDKFIEQIVQNQLIKTIQISEAVPSEAFYQIDRILEKRPDICFRIYGLYNEEKLDLLVLRKMKYLTRLWLDWDMRDCQNVTDFDILCDLSNLKSLQLNLFNLKDYSFIKSLSNNLERLIIHADTLSGGIKFDCCWLLKYNKLHTLFLGKKAKKNIEKIRYLPNLRKITLQGIKLDDFEFMKELNIESLSIGWCASTNLHQLGEFTSLKHLELWRIMKLEDISFISKLIHLESLSLIDLKHVRQLPDLSKLTNLQHIKLDNVAIDLDSLDSELKRIVYF